MRLSFLKHLLDSVTALACPVRVCVLGSSSLLPQHPDLGEREAVTARRNLTTLLGEIGQA